MSVARPGSDYREEVYESIITPVVTLCEALETARTSIVNRKVVCKHLHSSVSFSASSLVREKAALKGRYYSAIAQLASPLAFLFSYLLQRVHLGPLFTLTVNTRRCAHSLDIYTRREGRPRVNCGSTLVCPTLDRCL